MSDEPVTIEPRAFVAERAVRIASSSSPASELASVLDDLVREFGAGFALLFGPGDSPDEPRLSAGEGAPPIAPALLRLGAPTFGRCVELPVTAVLADPAAPAATTVARVIVGTPSAGAQPRGLLVMGTPADSRDRQGALDAATALLPILGANLDRVGSPGALTDLRFALALAHTGDAVEICNGDAIIEWVNPAFETVTGYSRAEAIGRTPAALFRAGQHSDAFYDQIDAVLRRGETWRGRMIGRRKSGDLYPQDCTFTPVMRFDGQIDCVIATRRDITDRIRAEAEERNRRGNEVFRSLTEVLPDGVLVLQRGDVVLANPAMARLLGQPDPTAIVLHGLKQSFVPHEAAAFNEWLAAQASGDEPQVARTWQGAGVDRQPRALEFKPVPWLSYEGGAALLLVVRDVTERHELQARLVLADRLSAMGQLLAGVGHEINNPLAYALASLETLRVLVPDLMDTETVDDALRQDLQGCLDDAWHGMRRIADTVADFRAFSRVRADRGRVDLRRLIDLTTKMAQNEIRPRARLLVRIGAVPPFDGEENRIAQVLLNLLVNAAQAIPEGQADVHEIRLEVDSVDEFVEIVVADTGPGIPPELQRRIFEPFFTTKASRGGSGLGLSICHAIARELGGSLSVHSEYGHGATFRFRLPVQAPIDGAGGSGELLPELEPRPVRRVLVIDDEPLVGRALERILPGDNVVVALGGRDGLARLQSDGPWDAVLCDLVMPDLSGAEVFETVTRTRPELALRFVFMTGGAFTPRLRAFLDRRPGPVLNKPFESRAVRAAVEAAARS